MAGIGDELFLFFHVLHFRAHDALGEQTHNEEGKNSSESKN